MTVQPKDISVNIEHLQVYFTWQDGQQQILSHQQLREACNCAFCKTKRFTGYVVTTDQQVTITEMYDQGYGVQICFSDGHDKGIYPWIYLKSLTEN